MIKKILDTNLYIDLFVKPDLYADIFVSEGPIYLSSVVIMELFAGAHFKKEKHEVLNLVNLFKRLGRTVTPSARDYEKAGEILIRLQTIKSYNLRKCASITNDCLIAASSKSIGAVIYTQNKKDFQTIKDVFDFKVIFV